MRPYKIKQMNIYGVLTTDGTHTDVSKTEKGAKNYASRHGHKYVSIRYNCGHNAQVLAMKKGRKWVYIDEIPQIEDVTNPLYLSTREQEII